jgi:hypothetical protein
MLIILIIYIQDVVADNNKNHIYSVRSLYSIIKNANQSLVSWSKIDNELKSWTSIQQSLGSKDFLKFLIVIIIKLIDLFFQRLSVADGNQKQQMRAWYEAMIDIGTKYFGISMR